MAYRLRGPERCATASTMAVNDQAASRHCLSPPAELCLHRHRVARNSDQVAHFTHNVRRWCNGAMIVRWVATAVREAETKFRRLKGDQDMPRLVAALDAHQRSLQIDKRKKVAEITRDRGAVTRGVLTANGTSPVEQ